MRSNLDIFSLQFRKEILLNSRQYKLIINSCLFYVMMVVFFPLAMPADPRLLKTIAPGIIWMAILFAFLLSSERLFQQDFEEGVIEQWLVSEYPLSLLVNSKLLASWLLTILPLLLFTPLAAVLYGLNTKDIAILELSVLLGSPAILYLCALVAAFSSGIKQKGVLMALILLPLTIPILIFGSSTLQMTMQGFPVKGNLALLLAMSVVTMTFLPFAIASVIRYSLTE